MKTPTFAVALATWARVAKWEHLLRAEDALPRLQTAMRDAAYLVRLTNDIGSPLLEMGRAQRLAH